jgi:hypothetical protein
LVLSDAVAADGDGGACLIGLVHSRSWFVLRATPPRSRHTVSVGSPIHGSVGILSAGCFPSPTPATRFVPEVVWPMTISGRIVPTRPVGHRLHFEFVGNSVHAASSFVVLPQITQPPSYRSTAANS